MTKVKRYDLYDGRMLQRFDGYYYTSDDYNDLKRRLVEAEKIAARWNWFVSQDWSLDAVRGWGSLDFDFDHQLESYIDNKLL